MQANFHLPITTKAMQIAPTTRMRKLEFAFLIGLVFFLPLMEVPKNLCWFGFVLTWSINCYREKSLGPWQLSDSLITALVASGYLVAIFSGVRADELGGANDLLRYGSVFFCIHRANYSRQEIRLVLITLTASCVITLGLGCWIHYVAKKRSFVELYSVGHVNHTATFLAIMCGMLLAALLSFFGRWGIRERLTVSAALGILLWGLLVGSSRGAIVAFLVVPFILSAAWWVRSKRVIGALIIGMALFAGTALLGNFAFVEKQRQGFQNDPLSHRDTIWRRAIIGFEIHPWFGFGINNFRQINDDMVRAKVEANGEIYETERYLGANHAHSLYFNTLAERGLVGSSVFLACLIASLIALIKYRPSPHDDDYIWMLWGTSASSWVVIVLAGLFNTSFHHEIAILALLLYGLWLSVLRKEKAAA